MRKASLLLAIAAPAALACGVCVEDKVAATYDHAVLQRAGAQGQAVVFCEFSGAADAKRIRAAARQVPGLDVVSLRLSAQPAAVSFAIDPARQSPRAAAAALQRGLPAGTHVTILRVVTAQGLGAAQR